MRAAAFPSASLEALLLAQVYAQRDGDDDLDIEIDRRIERLRALDEDGFAAALPTATAAVLDALVDVLAPRLDVSERDVAWAEATLEEEIGHDTDLEDGQVWEAELGRIAGRATATIVRRVARERGTVAAPPRRPASALLQHRATRLPRARDRAHRPTAARRRCRGSSPPCGDPSRPSGDDPPGLRSPA